MKNLRRSPVVILAAAALGVVGVAQASAAKPKCFGKTATIVGTPGADSIRAGPGNDVIVGLGGNDRLGGGTGNDLVCGGPGHDLIVTGRGNDKVDGGDGNDTLHAADDNDTTLGGDGNDFIDGRRTDTGDVDKGEAGDDTILGGVLILGGPGKDTINGADYVNDANIPSVIKGGPGNDRIRGRTGHDKILGLKGDDSLLGLEGNDRLEGGLGN